MSKRIFKIVLIKPSHYDHQGYVIQWWRSTVPSNSLASVHGILAMCAESRALGPDVEIDIEAYDECNTIIDVAGAIARIKAAGGGFVGLVGVQTNQFPRGVDLARQFRAARLPVVIGGFHVSGLLAMLPEPTADLKEALDLGVSFFAGESEGRMLDLLRDIDQGKMKQIYNYLGDAAGMEAAALPMLPKEVIARVAGKYASFDAGRGCPFQCSFCTIINVQGRKSRYRSADDVEAIVRANAARGIWRFFVTDDNFARNKNWEPILDRLIKLQEEGMRFRLLLQVDTLCHHTPGFIEKAAKAGCNAVFIGLENINPESLMGAKKRQNKIWEYREMLQAWRAQRVMTWAGYILGFPTDTPQSIARDIEIIKRELPVDILEFFYLTPLPGSEDHKKLALAGVAMDPDMNKYDLEHVCTSHPIMSDETWRQVYRDAWARYYTMEHVETVLRRARVSGLKLSKVLHAMTVFSGSSRIEKVHPLQFGLIRRKIRTQRRYGMKIENPLIFYPWRAVGTIATGLRWYSLVRRHAKIRRKVETDPNPQAYTDIAMQKIKSAEDFVERVFADKIPDTYGAPVKHAAAAPV